MSVKHVAFIVKYFPTVSETFIVNQINGLMDDGYQVHLFAYNKIDSQIIHKSLKKYDLLNKVKYFVKPPISKLSRLLVFFKWIYKNFFKIRWHLFFKSLNVFKYGKDAYTLKLFFEAQWFLVPYDFELIHAHFGMNGNRIANLKAFGILSKNVKLVTTFHGYDLVPNKINDYKYKYSYLFKEANAFTVNTLYLKKILQQINNQQKPCYILPVGLDTNFFKKQSKPKQNKYFDMFFCGKLIPLKGPDIAIDILKKLHELSYLNVRLHLIGNGILRSQLEEQAKVYNLLDKVYFYNSLSQEEIVNHFHQADVFLLPGRNDPETGRAETQGLVIQEAQSMGIPVVVSDVGGMKYGLSPNKSGFVIANEDIDAFVAAIQELIMNPKLKLSMGENGEQFVKIYDNKILVKKLQEIYNTID